MKKLQSKPIAAYKNARFVPKLFPKRENAHHSDKVNPGKSTKKARFSIENRTFLELLGRFELPTSSLPIDPSAFWAVPIHVTKCR